MDEEAQQSQGLHLPFLALVPDQDQTQVQPCTHLQPDVNEWGTMLQQLGPHVTGDAGMGSEVQGSTQHQPSHHPQLGAATSSAVHQQSHLCPAFLHAQHAPSQAQCTTHLKPVGMQQPGHAGLHNAVADVAGFSYQGELLVDESSSSLRTLTSQLCFSTICATAIASVRYLVPLAVLMC